MSRGRSRLASVVASTLVLTACLSDGSAEPQSSTPTDSAVETTLDPGPGFTIPPPPGEAVRWAVDTSRCSNPTAANAEITSSITIGTAAPQSGGLVSSIYAPVLVGFQAYIDRANADQVLGDVQISLEIADDKGQPELTPVAVDGLLEAGASVISALPGSVNNLAVRQFLNDNCIPQVMSLANTARLGDPRNFPWTIGGVVTENVETTIYANTIRRDLGDDATVALLVTNDDSGTSYAAAFANAADEIGIDVVVQQTVEPAVIDPPSAQMLTIAGERPQVIVASLTGAACATFLTELGKARVALPDWRPDVYLGNDCADSSILRLAGSAADGVLSSSSLVIDDPEFVELMRSAGLTDGFARAALGWTAAEVTVEMLGRAQQSDDGLTRASIIAAARHLAYRPSLARPGVEYTTNGLTDGYPVESLQIVRFDAATQSFVDVGSLIAQFES